MPQPIAKRCVAEALGTFFLPAAVVGYAISLSVARRMWRRLAALGGACPGAARRWYWRNVFV